jgi:hypothetical protein
MSGIQLPTKIRLMSSDEYDIVTRVFSDTLPFRIRILVTNAAGESGRAFTIPTSLLTTLGLTATTFLAGAAVGYLTSFINLAYLMNVGNDYDKLATSQKGLLVHETAHVWQGKNSTQSLSYVFNSVINQCLKGNAYAYVAGKPWSDYGVEQQASIVEDWFVNGEKQSGDLWPYIQNHVRKGDA